MTFAACTEHLLVDLPYLAKAEDADRRLALGERQQKCKECGLWQWPEPTARESCQPDQSTDTRVASSGGSGQ
jgi:hypothetical protein